MTPTELTALVEAAKRAKENIGILRAPPWNADKDRAFMNAACADVHVLADADGHSNLDLALQAQDRISLATCENRKAGINGP